MKKRIALLGGAFLFIVVLSVSFEMIFARSCARENERTAQEAQQMQAQTQQEEENSYAGTSEAQGTSDPTENQDTQQKSELTGSGTSLVNTPHETTKEEALAQIKPLKVELTSKPYTFKKQQAYLIKDGQVFNSLDSDVTLSPKMISETIDLWQPQSNNENDFAYVAVYAIAKHEDQPEIICQMIWCCQNNGQLLLVSMLRDGSWLATPTSDFNIDLVYEGKMAYCRVYNWQIYPS